MAKLQYGNLMLEELPLTIRLCSTQMILRHITKGTLIACGTSGTVYKDNNNQLRAGQSNDNYGYLRDRKQASYYALYDEATETWGPLDSGNKYYESDADLSNIVWTNNGIYNDSYVTQLTRLKSPHAVSARGYDLRAVTYNYSSTSAFTVTAVAADGIHILVTRTALSSVTPTGCSYERVYSTTHAAGGVTDYVYIYRVTTGEGSGGSIKYTTSGSGRFRLFVLTGSAVNNIDFTSPAVSSSGDYAYVTNFQKPTPACFRLEICPSHGSADYSSDSTKYLQYNVLQGLDPALRLTCTGQAGTARCMIELDDDPTTLGNRWDKNPNTASTAYPTLFIQFPFTTAALSGDAEYTHNLAAADKVVSNSISWTAETPTGSSAKVSVKLGDGEYVEVQSGGAIPGINIGQSMPASTLKIKVELTREDASVVPSISNLRVDVHGITSSSASSVVIPRMAMLALWNRARCGELTSEWVPEQIYYLATREKDKDTGVLKLHAYDAMMRGEQTYADFTGFTTWPQKDSDVVAEIMDLLGLTWDSRNVQLTDYMVEYPNDLTMREVLGYIAASYCSNLTMAMELVEGVWLNTIRMVPLSGNDDTVDVGSSYTELNADAPLDEYSKVTVWYDDTDAFEAGDNTGRRLEVDQLYAKQAMADDMLARVAGFAYQPFTATGAIVHPLAELGDHITMDEVTSIICTMKREYDLCGFADVSAPVDDEVDYEYKFVSPADRKLARKVSLGQDYYGTKITRERGLVIEKIDGDDQVIGEAVFNSDVLAMRAMIDGQMKDCIYFDTTKGTYKISGDVEVEGAIESEAVITDAIYAEQGDIAQLTVDVLNTSRRIAKYLMEDQTDDNHFEASGNTIAFIASIVVYDDITEEPLTEQLVNRYGDPVFWKEDISEADIIDGYPYIEGHRVYTTTDNTGYPVTVYQYTNQVKRKIAFEYDPNQRAYIPTDTFGAGNNEGRNVGRIYKDTKGLVLEYLSGSGKVSQVSVGDYVDATHRRLSYCNIGNGVVTYQMEGDATQYNISYVVSGNRVTYTWPDGHTCEVSL